MTEQEINAMRLRVAKGYAELRALCAGRFRMTADGAQRGRDWTMTIPVQETDSDVVLYEALKVADELLDQLKAQP